jgi:hypothetical protein
MTSTMTTIVTICSPNLGIVDSWLPVLLAARDRHPGWRIVFIIPEAWDKMVRPEGAALRMASAVADEVVVEIRPHDFRAVADFSAAEALVRRTRHLPERVETVDRTVRRIVSSVTRSRSEGRMLASVVTRVLASLIGRTVRAPRADLASRSMEGPVLVCYDIETNQKIDCRSALADLNEEARFSLSHGLGIPIGPDERPAGVVARKDHRVYGYGPEHAEYYLRAPGMTAEHIAITGVPRHDPEALRSIRARSEDTIDAGWAGSVLLVSRQATSQRETPGKTPRDWLPAGRKVEQLRAIHRVVCEQQGLRLLVSTHPKEREDGTLQRGLPSGSEGHTWRFTTVHPLVLAEHVDFAIAFSSGVVLDLLAFGIPSIEFQDASGASAYDGPDALRDPAGRILRTAQRRGGLVLPADDERDLAHQVHRIRTQRDDVLAELTTAYRRLYASPEGAIDRILLDLEQAVDEHHSRVVRTEH